MTFLSSLVSASIIYDSVSDPKQERPQDFG